MDIIPEKVEMINNRKSPIQDDYIDKYLAEKDLNLKATLDGAAAYSDADFVLRVGMVESRFRYRDAGSWQKERELKHYDYQKLAEEFLAKEYLSEAIIYDLYARYDKEGFILADFGYFLGVACKEETATAEAIIDYSIKCILKNDYAKDFRQSSFFFSFIHGYGQYSYAANVIRSHAQLNYLLFPLYGMMGVKVEDTGELFGLVAEGKCDSSHFIQYCHRVNWMEQEDSKVLLFFDRLIKLGREG